MTDSLVSVVIPSYGRPEMVTGAVETVREQTYDPVELVVVDDCSPEPIEPQVRALESGALRAVRVIRHEKNQGAAAARATGIEAATGEFIAFLDDDDRWSQAKLQKQVEALQEWGPDAGVAYTGMRYVDADGETIREHVPTESGDLTKTLLCRNVVGSYSTVLVRAAAIEAVGLPDQRFPSWQDMEWYVRLSQDWAFVAVDEPLTVIYQASDHEQISDDFSTIRDDSYPLFVEKYRPLAAEYGWRFERKMLAWAAFRVGGYNALRTEHFADARRFLLRAVRLYPLELKFWLYLVVALGGNPMFTASKRVKRALLD